MTTTKKEFETFKQEFIRWQNTFGLTQYRVCFEHRFLSDAYAIIDINEPGKLATVVMCNKVTLDDKAGWKGPEIHAKHEAIHLLLHRLYWLGTTRCINCGDLEEEWESLVRRLEKVL